MLGLCCYAGISLVVASGGLLFIVARGLLIVSASLMEEHGLHNAWTSVVVVHGLGSIGSQALEHRLNNWGTWAYLLCCMWDHHRSEIKPVFPAME